MLICDEEIQILRFLQGCPDAYFAATEICRKAGSKKLVMENPRWALPFLTGLLDKKLVERDPQGHYRFIPEYKPKDTKP